eukprot:EG_transcript_16453
MRLTEDLLHHIFSFLDEPGLQAIVSSSRHLRIVASAPHLWEGFCRLRFPRMHADITEKLLRCTAASSPNQDSDSKKGPVACNGELAEPSLQQCEEQRHRLAHALATAEEDVERCHRQIRILNSNHTSAAAELNEKLAQLKDAVEALREQLADVDGQVEDLQLERALSEASGESCGQGFVEWRALYVLRLRQRCLWRERKANRRIGRDLPGSAQAHAAFLRTCTRCYRAFMLKDNTHRACRHHPAAYSHDSTRCPCGGAVFSQRPTLDNEVAALLLKCRRQENGQVPSNWRRLLGCDCVFHYQCCGSADVYSEGCAVAQHECRR